ncbi:MAG TPA: flagellar hook-length control protein FliK [Candidimonas sp.]|nr:flagellar hook-length control protein FliK [Candidimonas sp.]
MSIGGPSALGTLLVHRLDSVLGTTLSQQANVVSGARPDAVSQPGHPERPDATQNPTRRHARDAIDRATSQAEQQGRPGVERARLDARMAALLAARNAPDTATTRSAPTVLGHAAKTILALLAKYPDQTAVQGKTPLLTGQAREPAGARIASGANTAVVNSSRADSPVMASRAQQTAFAAAGSNPGASATAAATGTGALSQAGGGIAGQLAQALSQALQSSGMFYESHLANLTTGKQSLTQLLQEPQAQSSRTAAGPANTAPPNAAQPGHPATSTAPANTPAPQAADGQSGNPATNTSTTAQSGHASAATTSGASSSGSAAPGNAGLPMPGLDPQTHLLVRQQLEVLANQTFAWRGEAWPDTPMDWEVSRREPTPDDTDLPLDTDHWATRITLHLPVLGEVQARITLAGQAVVMQLIAPESAGLLGEHADALRSRFSARGLQMSQLNIAQDNFAAAIAAAHDQDMP